MTHIPPKYKYNSFNCPNCGVLAEQTWSNSVIVNYSYQNPSKVRVNDKYGLEVSVARCRHCSKISIWENELMIIPIEGNIEAPNEDMPTDVLADYDEAKKIVNLSPRGACALLRLAVQKLCKHLGEKGNNINADIKSLVEKGLPISMQQALDSVRVIGNNAVHPGQLNLKDDTETAYQLFGLLNIICESLITQPKKIKEIYEMKVPENNRQAIEKRDNKNSSS